MRHFTRQPKANSNSSIYSYHRVPVYTNSALEFVLDFSPGIPEVSYAGPGNRVKNQLRVAQVKPYVFLRAVPTAGIGGPQAGVYYSQPLIDNGSGDLNV